MNKWKYDKLSNLCEKIGDGLHGTPVYTDFSDIYFINGNNLKNGKIEITIDTKKVTSEVLSKNFIPLNENTLLLSINGNLGNMAFYKNEKIMLGKSCAYINLKSNINRFYYYYFQIEEIKIFFNNEATGSTIKNLSLKSLQDFQVPIPDKKDWGKIVAVLSDLDSKIELNNRINAELEAMAKTIYDYWFVQFDFPNENGKPYKSSGCKMAFNKQLKREIPDGWNVKRLNDIETNIITGKTPPTTVGEYYNDDVPFITIGDIRGNMHIINTEIKLSKAGADYQKNKYIPKGAICVTCIASPGLVGFATTESQTNQQINSVVCAKQENKHYLLFALKDHFIFSIGAKTGNTFANMNKEDFYSIPFILPSTIVLSLFESKIAPISNMILNNSFENHQLTQLRDWLLPMLMNGQVKVKGAENIVNENTQSR